ncbi:MAG: tRNA lysidine(34) synthetase TilS [Sphingomonas sp.]
MEERLLSRFSDDLDPLIAPGAPIGLAVSGGPDSLALLLLAAAARPGQVEAATVDHGFRAEAAAEGEMVAAVCARLGVPHVVLAARWAEKPETAIQERARRERYRLLGFWAEERRLPGLVTAHHADDQAETFLMRLARGAGVRGLAAMRARSVAPGAHVRLVRPLLGWRRAELEQICADAGLTPALDPSNGDDRFERARVRRALAECSWLDPAAIARAAANLTDADKALDWAAKREWDERVKERRSSILYRPNQAPSEIVRRIVSSAIRKLASEGDRDLRGPELARLISTLEEGGTATLRGVLCSGGSEWRFVPAPNRTRPVDNLR